METTQPKFIYESPDGGHTVYRRTIGNPHRELHSEGPAAQANRALAAENQLWHNIRHAALSNPELAHLLEQVVIYYRLTSEN